MPTESRTMRMRLAYSLIGAVAGLAAWALVDLLPGILTDGHVFVLIAAAGFGFFGVLLALLGPVGAGRAALAALAMAAPAALLLFWASFRHRDAGAFMDRGYDGAALVYLLAIGVPFVIAGLHRAGGWRHYGALFDAAWTLVMRVAAAWLFALTVWLVLLLSGQLLGLVGVSLIADLIALAPMPYLISGIALGLGLAIVHELRDYLAPFLAIQLLRALLPVLLAVLAVFIAALPLRGLSGLFGQFSAAATLLAVTVTGITLISTAIHRDDAMSVQGRGMLLATRLLGALLPVPAGLALWAVWMRVDQYGLTPNRIAAGLAACVALVHALAYAASLLAGDDWRRYQRGVNRRMVLATLAIAALWLTPVLNPERLASASQVARAGAGVPVAQLPLWEMAHDWGVAGQRALAAIEARLQDEDLSAQILRARRAPNRWDYMAGEAGDDSASLDALVPLRPEGRTLPPGALDALDGEHRREIRNACGRRLTGGHPGCVIVIAPFEPSDQDERAIGFYAIPGGGARLVAYRLEADRLVARGSPSDIMQGAHPQAAVQVIVDILTGQFRLVPAPRIVLDVGNMQLFPQN